MFFKLKKIFAVVLLSTGLATLQAQTVQLLNSGTQISIRGLSVVNNNIVWVSGSQGTVGKSTDGGVSWQLIKIKALNKLISGTLKHSMIKLQL